MHWPTICATEWILLEFSGIKWAANVVDPAIQR